MDQYAPLRAAIPTFLAVVTLGGVVSAAIFYLLTEHLGLAYARAQSCATALITAVNFMLYQKVVFNERKGRALVP